MSHIRKFNESEENQRLTPKVKHLIQYLQELDPESLVYLDHDGWFSHVSLENETDEVELIKNRGIFDYHNGRLMINN